MQEIQETQVWALGREDSLEKGMATHCSILAWRIPWTEEPGGLQSMGSQRARHNWATNANPCPLIWLPQFCHYPKGFVFFLNQILSSGNSTIGGRSEWGDGSSLSSSKESGFWESWPESRQKRFQLLSLLFLPVSLSFFLCFLPPPNLEGSQQASPVQVMTLKRQNWEDER